MRWLAVQLGMSPSQLHSAVKRALAAQLAVRKGDEIVPNIRNLEEFLVHGLKYVFVPVQGEMTRGIPTGHAAPPLNQHFVSTAGLPPVSALRGGGGEGFCVFAVVQPGAPGRTIRPATLRAPVLVDAIRGGRARERELAIKELKKRLEHYA